MKYYEIPNLDKWQHYKDRCPPWIKLHRDTLRDYEFACLPDASKAHLIQIWLLASQMDNKIPVDNAWISKQINATTKIDLNLLEKQGFLRVASDMIADCKHFDVVETETETETETDHAATEFDFEKKPFKKWSNLDFRQSVIISNIANILLEDEIEDFIEYWCEKSSKGQYRFSMEKTWDTSRRMKNAVRMIYSERREKNKTKEWI